MTSHKSHSNQPSNDLSASPVSNSDPKMRRPNIRSLLSAVKRKRARSASSSTSAAPSSPDVEYLGTKRAKSCIEELPSSMNTNSSILFRDLQIVAAISLDLLDPLSLLQDWHNTGALPSRQYRKAVFSILQGQFPSVTTPRLNLAVEEKVYLLTSFLNLLDEEENQDVPLIPLPTFNQERLHKHVAHPTGLTLRESRTLQAELTAVDLIRQDATIKRRRDEIVQNISEEVECSCCSEESDIKNAFFCTGEQVHFFCYECLKSYVEVSLIGSGKCAPDCFAITESECHGIIEMAQIKAVLSDSSVTRLERMQQQQSLREAFTDEVDALQQGQGREALEQCPKCEYQAWVDASLTDTLFECINPACGQISCRACREKVHNNMTCEEAKAKPTIEHAVEEALSSRTVRVCTKCNNRTIKETDNAQRTCNKMFCPTCNTVSCFICGETGINYDHFDKPKEGKHCSLWKMPDINPAAIESEAVIKLIRADPSESQNEEQLRKRIRVIIAKHVSK